ncbi:hypothetical protein [Prevotella sp. 10(H)]|uniref:hypothetical protein n=1 Tax=Prevotella sp. 10(H) TaxID=1158294 RepID=UPI000B1F2A20|nr:hypothetical protein [Prevotella sp. 10(H)]
MSRRTELEKEIEIAKKRMDDAPKDTPEDVKEQWIKELDSLSVELNNLYDDNENDFPN